MACWAKCQFLIGNSLVCSRTLRANDYKNVTITPDAAAMVSELKEAKGKDIWLFGGSSLFRSLLDAELVDTIEVAVMPVLLSQGIPLLPKGEQSPKLRLTESKALPSGVINLTYAIEYARKSKVKKTKSNKAPKSKAGISATK